MNGIHDVGGMDGFALPVRDQGSSAQRGMGAVGLGHAARLSRHPRCARRASEVDRREHPARRVSDDTVLRPIPRSARETLLEAGVVTQKSSTTPTVLSTCRISGLSAHVTGTNR